MTPTKILFNMDFLSGLAAIGSALGSILNPILGLIGVKETNKTAKENQRETNEANKELAEQSNQWNIEQWQRENAYNSPSAQVARLRAAGWNPLFGDVNSGMAGTGLTAVTPVMQQADLGGAAAQSANLIGALNSGVSALKGVAEVRKLNEDTNKTIEETNSLRTSNAFLSDLLKGQLELNNSQVLLNVENTELTRKQGKKIMKECEVFDAQVGVLKSQFDKVQQETKNLSQEEKLLIQQGELNEQDLLQKKIDNYFRSTHWKSVLDNLRTQTGMMSKQTELFIKQGVTQFLTNGLLALDYKFKKGTLQFNIDMSKLENQTSQFMFEQLKQYSDADHIINYGKELLIGLGAGLAGFGQFSKGVSSKGLSYPSPNSSISAPSVMY